MQLGTARISAYVLITSAVLLSGCGGESKDELMGQIITDCQLNAHSAMETQDMTDEKKHFAIGQLVERCLRQGGLQPLSATQGDTSCFEAPNSTEDGNGFIKPLQKCWKNPKSPKS